MTSRYGFIHSLYRHAIDARLTGAVRARLHQRIGEYKEAGRGDRAGATAAELAVHFEQARDHRRASRYLALAADNAVHGAARSSSTSCWTLMSLMLPLLLARERRVLARDVLLLAVLPFVVLHSSASAQEEPGRGDLVKKARNPLADLVSVQVQPNFNFGVGQNRDTEYVFDIQPVIPIHLPAAWNLFTRTVVPLINEPGSEPGQGYTFGMGDIQTTLFLSPPSSKTFIWGVGPVLQFPSASATSLGSGKWEIGPTAAAILTWGSWQVGTQVNNLWSFAGDRTRPAVNQMLLQPLVNYALPDDWYLTSGPQVTANWKASSRDRWTVPVGGGIGKVFTIWQQAVSAQAEAYYNAERPAGGPTWSVILTVQFMFPR